LKLADVAVEPVTDEGVAEVVVAPTQLVSDGEVE
jgi:hypothetical protein